MRLSLPLLTRPVSISKNSAVWPTRAQRAALLDCARRGDAIAVAGIDRLAAEVAMATIRTLTESQIVLRPGAKVSTHRTPPNAWSMGYWPAWPS